MVKGNKNATGYEVFGVTGRRIGLDCLKNTKIVSQKTIILAIQ